MVLMTALLLSLSSATFSQEAASRDIEAVQIDSPSGESAYFQSVRPMPAQPDPSWTIRTGVKKGVLDRTLDAEVFAGPDAAVLKSGFFEPWQALLAEFKEPSVLVEPGQIAGLEKHKPYLIVPSGALHNAAGSEFFKAGLAEYVHAGGVIICFTQQNAADYTALPVPAGERIEAKGWQQDGGPLFRASAIQGQHPMLAGTRKTLPDIETSGYLIAFPKGSQVLMSRPDGFPTLILYPYGSGQVIIAAMFSDFSYGYGHLEQDEKNLVHDILTWAKYPAQTVPAWPGGKLSMTLSVRGPDQGEAASARLMVIGPEGDKPVTEEIVPALVKANAIKPIQYQYTVLASTQPGLYHVEYLLLNAAGQPLGIRTECEGTRFSIGQPQAAAPLPRLKQPLSGFPAQFRLQPQVDRSGSTVRLRLAIIPGSPSTIGLKQTYFVRTSGQEKSFTLGPDTTTLSFDIPEQDAGKTISFALYHSSGRSLARGTVPSAGPVANKIAPDKQTYLPGQNVVLTLSNLGNGELILTVPGRVEKQLVTGKATIEFRLPDDLPAGTYPLRWTFTPLEGAKDQGEVFINIAGYRVHIEEAVLSSKTEGTVSSTTARLRILAPRKLTAQVKLFLRSPDNKVTPVAENTITLQEGAQDVPCTFTGKPETAGMGELLYSLSVRLPDGPGLGKKPLTMARGRILFDSGESALIGVAPAKQVYYEPTEPVELSAYVFGKGRAKVELFLDSKRIQKEKLDLTGLSTLTVIVPTLAPGVHAVKAVVAGEKLESVATCSFIYGARLPDLVISIKTSEPTRTIMNVGVGIKNQGKSPSVPGKAALYSGDPEKGGTLLAYIDVPALDPDKLHVAIIDWPLFKQAGARTLTALVDPDNRIVESNKSNNRISAEVKVPEFLLSLTPRQNSFSIGDKIEFALSLANLTTTTHKDLGLSIELLNGLGKSVSVETVPLSEIAAGAEKKIDRAISFGSLPVGAYRLKVQLSRKGPLAETSTVVNILPTLLLSGELTNTQPTASLCVPLNIQYSVKNIGNIPVSTGSLKIEIKAGNTDQPVFARQIPFTTDPSSIRIENVNFPQGAYTITLKASAMNKDQNITRDFTLAAQALTVSAPIVVKKGSATIPRVLVWLGRSGIAVQEALAETIVKQAFDDEGVYYTIVNKASDFISRSMSGSYNTAVLFETDELLDQTDWLQDRVARGQGLVIIGSDDRMRATAETFGFTFDEVPASPGAMLQFTKDSGMGLSGTMPVSGQLLSPRKRSAKTAALFAKNDKPALLIDKAGNGQVMVMPYSFTRSALDTGTTSLYSLLLRAAVRRTLSESKESPAIFSLEFAVSAAAGAVKAQVVETLPAGSRVIWTNAEGTVAKNTIRYDLIADREPQRLLSIYQPPAGTSAPAVAEVFYECGGKLMSQGKVE